MTKYEIADDHEWADEKQADDPAESPVSVDSHTVDIIHTTNPDADMGYGRDKYTVHIVDESSWNDGTPYATHAVKHRWKGNFWRETKQVDWRDLPPIVRKRVLSLVPCLALDPGCRLVDEGGRSVWSERQDRGDSE